MLTVNNYEIRLPITTKDREIQQANLTYAFISNLVPHIFGELYFYRSWTWIHEEYSSKGAFQLTNVQRTRIHHPNMYQQGATSED